MFFTYKNINLNINGNTIFANDLSLSQQANLYPILRSDKRVTADYNSRSNIEGNLKITYYLTGQDPLKSYIYSENNQFLTGNIAGLTFVSGVLTDYQIHCAPNLPVAVSANIQFYDPLVGAFTPQTPNNLNLNLQILNLFSAVTNTSTNNIENFNNIIDLSFNYKGNIKPIYYINSGINVSAISADRIFIGERQISSEFIVDSFGNNLTYAGEKYGLKIYFVNPSNTGIQETFACSGIINKKELLVSTQKTAQSRISMVQGNVNDYPGITSSSQNPFNLSSPYILTVTGLNFSNTYEVDIADRICPVLTGSDTQLIVSVPLDTIPGNITVKTTRGNAVFTVIFPGMVAKGTDTINCV